MAVAVAMAVVVVMVLWGGVGGRPPPLQAPRHDTAEHERDNGDHSNDDASHRAVAEPRAAAAARCVVLCGAAPAPTPLRRHTRSGQGAGGDSHARHDDASLCRHGPDEGCRGSAEI